MEPLSAESRQPILRRRVSPGRCRLRHQLRRPGSGQPGVDDAVADPRSWTSCFATSRPSGPGGRYLFDKPKLITLMEQGSAVMGGLGNLVTCSSRKPGAARQRRSRRVSDLRHRATTSAARSGREPLASQVVDRVIDEAAAAVMGLRADHRADPLGRADLATRSR